MGLAVPMALASLLEQLYNMVDSIVAGNWLGETGVAAVGASPFALRMSSPGQSNFWIVPAIQSLTGPHWAMAKIAMTRRYGA